MEAKKWYMSKTIWAGIVAVFVAVYNSLTMALADQCGIEGSFCVNLPGVPSWIFAILAAFGIYGRGSATTKIE